MFDGTITNDSFAAQKFRDPAVLALHAEIKVAEDPVLTRGGGGAVPTRVTATLTDGSGFPGRSTMLRASRSGR